MTRVRTIGALSGTSMDGITVGAFEFAPNELPISIACKTYALPPEYKTELLNIINNGNCSLDLFGQTDHWVGALFGDAINAFLAEHNLNPNSINAIGSHGQTLWHAPKAPRPFTLQIGDPNIIAYKTGITTVGDFRRADMAAGGCGAPLAPAFHLAVFADASPRCIVNVGGFSNISILSKNCYLGFDTGPGNCLMDYWVKEHFDLDFDNGGMIANSGKVNSELLNVFLSDPYFALKAPKSTGREYFNPHWLESKLQKAGKDFSKLEVLTTLLHLTAHSIANEVKNNAPPASSVFICGGGAHNLELRQQLGLLLEQDVQTTATLGIDPDSVEAALFAWLAYNRITAQRTNLCATTGSKIPTLLGGIFAP